jgi:hypothetical protein
VRGAIANLAEGLAARLSRAPGWALGAAVLVGVSALFWLLCERHTFGDSYVFLVSIDAEHHFHFPEIGATFLIGRFPVVLSGWLRAVRAVQLGSCLMGGVAALVFWRVACELAPSRGRAAVLLALVSTGGVLRVFAGHIEVYAYTVVVLGLYLWAALVHLRGGVHWTVPCLALGVAIWMHVSTVLLVPSLLALPWLRGQRPGAGQVVAQGVLWGAVVAAPTLLFLGAYAIFDPQQLMPAWTRLFEVLGQSGNESAMKWWVRVGGTAEEYGVRVGIDYAFLSLSHLKYLANEYWLICPFALPAAAYLAVRRDALARAPRAAFLAIAAVPLVAYSAWLRPFWGPFDWDLFTIAPLSVGLLAAHALVHAHSDTLLRQLAVGVAGLQLIFVGGPFVSIGIHQHRDAGPFAGGSHYKEITKPGYGSLAPWL